MALGGVVHDGVGGGQLVDQRRIADVARHEREVGIRKPCERCAVARVGERVENRDVVVGVCDDVVHKVRTDDAGTAGVRGVT